jgi:hypothetical protein
VANGESDVAKRQPANDEDDIKLAAGQANALLPRVNAGDLHAQRALREILDGHPDLWASAGNLAQQAE